MWMCADRLRTSTQARPYHAHKAWDKLSFQLRSLIEFERIFWQFWSFFHLVSRNKFATWRPGDVCTLQSKLFYFLLKKTTKILVKRMSALLTGSESDVARVLSNQSVDAMAEIIRQSEEEPCVRESILSLEEDANNFVSYFTSLLVT